MRLTIEAWRRIDPASVVSASPAHIQAVISDARDDIIALHKAIANVRHVGNNALASVLLCLEDDGDGMTFAEMKKELERVAKVIKEDAEVASCGRSTKEGKEP